MKTQTRSLAKLGYLLRTQGLFIFTLMVIFSGCSSDKQNGRDYYSNNGAFRLSYPIGECRFNDNVCNGSRGGCNNNGCGSRSGCGSNMIEVSFNTQQELCNYIRIRIDSGQCNPNGFLAMEFQRFQCNFIGWNNNGVNVGVDIGIGTPQQPIITQPIVAPTQPPVDWIRLYEEELIRRITGYYTLNGCIAQIHNTFDTVDICMNDAPDLPSGPGAGEKDGPAVPEKDQVVVRRDEKDDIVVTTPGGRTQTIAPGSVVAQPPAQPATPAPKPGGVIPRANLLDHNLVTYTDKTAIRSLLGGAPVLVITGNVDSGSPIYNVGYSSNEIKEIDIIKHNNAVLSQADKDKLCPTIRAQMKIESGTIVTTFQPDRAATPEQKGICDQFFLNFNTSTTSLEFKFKVPLKVSDSVTVDVPFKLIKQ